ncbi:MAG: acylphosphatase [Xanthomonadales bacterium]|nr:acylphosphatase [Xanthomonadales bacterium]
MEKQCKRYLVSGKVQGVWYRASTQEQARRLGIDGYARNLSDGRVEVMASGPSDALDELGEWLWQGPKNARVSSVDCDERQWNGEEGFRIA